jgi:hypothetical protein
MSRLDSVIRRLQAQRACLARAAALIRDLPGPVLELGLGNGRTYDHLRETLPAREIFVFEREVAAHPDCVPPADHLLLGDIHDTLPASGPAWRSSTATWAPATPSSTPASRRSWQASCRRCCARAAW